MNGEEAGQDAIGLRDIEYQWPGKDAFTISLDQFHVGQGERLLLLGPSGSGKSTLLSLMTGIATPQSGAVTVLGTQINTLGGAQRDRFRVEHFGIIFQMFNLLPYGALVDNVLLPLSFAPKRKQRAELAGGAAQEAHRLLTALGLEANLHTKTAAELSVGQQQRVAVARALIGSPEIIVADEPTSALDSDRKQDFLDLLFAQVEQTGSSLVLVSHDQSLGAQFERSVRLRDVLSAPGRPKTSA